MKFIQPNWPSPTKIKAYTTLRSGWGESISSFPFHLTNRKVSKQLETLLHLPDEPIWLTQTHSSLVIEAIPKNRGKMADASFTVIPHHVCLILTADCLPILISNKKGTQVAAIHAGWRGLANNIIETTLSALKQPPEELLIWLGPAIGPRKFEVGEDVYQAFTGQHSQSFPAFIPHSEGKWLANLYELAKIRLQLEGIPPHHIYGGNYCTYTQADLFFSYRRDKTNAGRMASVIWIDQE